MRVDDREMLDAATAVMNEVIDALAALKRLLERIQGQIAPKRVRLVVDGMGNRQLPANRLDPIRLTMLVEGRSPSFGSAVELGLIEVDGRLAQYLVRADAAR